MRFIYSMSAALLGLALFNTANSAYAAPPSPRLVTHVGQFRSNELSAVSSPASAAKLDKAPRALIVEKSERPDVSLGAASIVSLKTGERIVKMPQMHKGLRVMGGGATVTFGDDNVARMVTTKLVDGLPDDVTPA